DRPFRLGLAEPAHLNPLPIPRLPDVLILDQATRSAALAPAAALDLGGIVKGALADILIDELGENAVCNLGGDLRVRGAGPDGDGWHIGLCDHSAVALTDGAVCTSGVTRRRWGQSMHHLIDPGTGMPARTVLAAALVTGQALRSAMFEGAMRNRELSSLHRFLTICWVPFVLLHVVTITIDSVARVSPIDLVIPFRVAYAALPVGLGAIGFDLLLIVTVTSYLRRRLDPTTWRWLHRLSYVMFGVFALHALLAGSDFARPLVLAPAAGVVAFIAIVSLARLAFGRWETTAH